jgi:hypothetical protein
MDEQQVMFSLGSIEGWVEKIGEMFKVDTKTPLGHVKLLEDEFKRLLAASKQLVQVQPQPQAKRDRRTLAEIEAEGERG